MKTRLKIILFLGIFLLAAEAPASPTEGELLTRLGLDPRVEQTKDKIKEAYRWIARKCHPDKLENLTPEGLNAVYQVVMEKVGGKGAGTVDLNQQKKDLREVFKQAAQACDILTDCQKLERLREGRSDLSAPSMEDIFSESEGLFSDERLFASLAEGSAVRYLIAKKGAVIIGLFDPDPSVRIGAVKKMAKMPGAIRLMIGVLEENKAGREATREVRAAIWEELAKITPSEEEVNLLIDFLKRTQHPFTLEAILKALAQAPQSPQTREVFLDYLNHESENVAEAALEGLETFLREAPSEEKISITDLESLGRKLNQMVQVKAKEIRALKDPDAFCTILSKRIERQVLARVARRQPINYFEIRTISVAELGSSLEILDYFPGAQIWWLERMERTGVFLALSLRAQEGELTYPRIKKILAPVIKGRIPFK